MSNEVTMEKNGLPKTVKQGHEGPAEEVFPGDKGSKLAQAEADLTERLARKRK